MCSKVTCCVLQPCHVVYTDYRPIPLQHYIFPAGGDGLHLVVDENVSALLTLMYSCSIIHLTGQPTDAPGLASPHCC